MSNLPHTAIAPDPDSRARPEHGEVSRRNFLAAVASGVISVSSLGTVLSLGATIGKGSAVAAAAPTGAEWPIGSAWQGLPDSLATALAPIQPGVGVLDGWRVVRAHFDRVPRIELAGPSDERLRVDLYRLDPARPVGVARSGHFDLVVINDGAGQRRTPPSQERALRVLAQVLARAEAQHGNCAVELPHHSVA